MDFVQQKLHSVMDSFIFALFDSLVFQTARTVLEQVVESGPGAQQSTFQDSQLGPEQSLRYIRNSQR